MKLLLSIIASAIFIYVFSVACHSFTTFTLDALWVGDWDPLMRAFYLFFSLALGVFVRSLWEFVD